MFRPSREAHTFRALPGVAASALALALVGGATVAHGAEPIHVSTNASRLTVHAGARSVMTYRYADVPYKPYVERFFTPAGVNVLRDAPHDHLHHHALMFAVAVDDVNFWEEHQAPGRQAHVRLDDVRIDTAGDLQRAAFTEQIRWVNPRDKKLHVLEARTIETYEGDDLGASLLTWQSRFTLPPGKPEATMTGSTYFGLGVRFVQSMDKGGTFTNGDGKKGVDGTNDKRSRWCAYSARADGKPVTFAIFDHPDNPRHPATWFTLEKGFAYVAATLNLSKEPLKLKAGKPLVLRYGTALWDGHPDAEAIEKLCKRWVKLQAGPGPKRVRQANAPLTESRRNGPSF